MNTHSNSYKTQGLWHFCLSPESNKRLCIQSMFCSPFFAPGYFSPPCLCWILIQPSNRVVWIQTLLSCSPYILPWDLSFKTLFSLHVFLSSSKIFTGSLAPNFASWNTRGDVPWQKQFYGQTLLGNPSPLSWPCHIHKHIKGFEFCL